MLRFNTKSSIDLSSSSTTVGFGETLVSDSERPIQCVSSQTSTCQYITIVCLLFIYYLLYLSIYC